MRFLNKFGSMARNAVIAASLFPSKGMRLVGLAAVIGLCAGLPVASQVFFLPNNAAVIGHLNGSSGPPVGTGCTMVAGSTDFAGSCTTSATSGSIAFAAAYTAAPSCLVVDATATPVAVYTTTTTQITLTTVTSAHVLYWTCIGKVGG